MSDQILKQILTKIDTIDGRISNIESKIGSMETRMDSMESRMESMETRMESMETRVDSMESSMNERFDRVEHKLSDMKKKIQEHQIENIEADNKILEVVENLKITISNNETNNTHKSSILNKRLFQLEVDVEKLKHG